jgi:hypothetical protein
MSVDAATKELIERLRQERDDARRDAAFVREMMAAVEPATALPDPPAEECARCGTVGPVDVPCRGCPTKGLDRLQASYTMPTHLPSVAPPSRAMCCRRLGSVWCTRTDTHAERACRGPEERELPANLLDRGRAR